MERRVKEDGESERRAVMVRIGVPTLPYPKGAPTSVWFWITRTFVEPNDRSQRDDGSISDCRDPGRELRLAPN